MRYLAWATVGTLICFWLFADTVKHYSPHQRNPNELRFSHFGTYQDYETWAQLISAFEREYPGVTISQEYVVGWYGLYDRKLRQQYLANSEPHLALVQAISFHALANQFAPLPVPTDTELSPLEPYAMDNVAMQLYRKDNAQLAMPVTGGNLLIYYNKKCFARASALRGAPLALPSDNWTMDEFESTARALTCDFDNDGKLDQFAFWQPRWVYYLPFVWSFGADVLDESGEQWLFCGEAASTAIDFYRRMRVQPNRYSPDPTEVSQIIQDVGFITGRTAMCVNGPWFMPTLNATIDQDEYGVADIPSWKGQRQTRVTWDGIAASRRLSPSELANAMKFIAFVGSPEGQRVLTRSARAIPARISEQKWFADEHRNKPAAHFIDALSYSRPEPQSDQFRVIDRILNQHLSEFVTPTNTMAAAELLSQLAADPAIAPLNRSTDKSKPGN